MRTEGSVINDPNQTYTNTTNQDWLSQYLAQQAAAAQAQMQNTWLPQQPQPKKPVVKRRPVFQNNGMVQPQQPQGGGGGKPMYAPIPPEPQPVSQAARQPWKTPAYSPYWQTEPAPAFNGARNYSATPGTYNNVPSRPAFQNNGMVRPYGNYGMMANPWQNAIAQPYTNPWGPANPNASISGVRNAIAERMPEPRRPAFQNNGMVAGAPPAPAAPTYYDIEYDRQQQHLEAIEAYKQFRAANPLHLPPPPTAPPAGGGGGAGAGAGGLGYYPYPRYGGGGGYSGGGSYEDYLRYWTNPLVWRI